MFSEKGLAKSTPLIAALKLKALLENRPMRNLAARIGRNPKTGEAVQLPKKVALHFKPGKALKDRVDAVSCKYRITD
jgi:hypothetical protein